MPTRQTLRLLAAAAIVLWLVGLPGTHGAEKSEELLQTGVPAVVNHVDGVPRSAFGRTFVYGVSPDFESNVVIQQGSKGERVKIQPKKSWEISGNQIGGMSLQVPRTPQSDFQPFLSINLIDGAPDTYWRSRIQAQSDVEPVWKNTSIVIANITC